MGACSCCSSTTAPYDCHCSPDQEVHCCIDSAHEVTLQTLARRGVVVRYHLHSKIERSRAQQSMRGRPDARASGKLPHSQAQLPLQDALVH